MYKKTKKYLNYKDFLNKNKIIRILLSILIYLNYKIIQTFKHQKKGNTI